MLSLEHVLVVLFMLVAICVAVSTLHVKSKPHQNAHILFIGRNGVFWLCMAGMVCPAYL
jgi:hypothetical protein